MSDETTEQREREIESLHRSVESDAEDLVEKASFADALERVTDRISGLAQLETDLERLESRGFVWTARIAELLAPLAEQGDKLLADVRRETNRAREDLADNAEALLRKARSMRPSLAMEPAIRAIGQDRDTLEKLVEAANDRIEALTDPFTKAYDSAKREIAQAKKHVDRFEEAEIPMLPEENLFATIKATWEDNPEEGKTEGMIFLTDLRFRFQGQQKVAKKKFLFITTESEIVRKLFIDAAIGHLDSSEDSKRGMLIKDQMLTLKWSQEAGIRGTTTTTFELDEGTAEQWDTVIEEIRSGAIARLKRQRETEGAAIGTPVKWPENCSGCDAPLPAPVKGMNTLVCPYCGQGHAIELA